MAKKFTNSFDLKKLCTPSLIYFMISALGMFIVGVQNLNGSKNTLCLGAYKCGVTNKAFIFSLNMLYILFWTFVLDLFCKTGYSKLSWFIVVIPILLSFVFAGLFVYNTQISLSGI